ncbi:hypothetical protein SCLCIDRAFT_24409 [Scleroderma citrinum Foug A]|uniref:Uncharacterized protein n=1 Tax=Scleroderma citrinum Foug A TaxID=1036808 RepID=A0A0C2ZNZ9_9AGAM|nr:hypothetical protein SCLCIDRAFT_24409 [Scleroderma citrinum Foug A]
MAANSNVDVVRMVTLSHKVTATGNASHFFEPPHRQIMHWFSVLIYCLCVVWQAKIYTLHAFNLLQLLLGLTMKNFQACIFLM